VRAFIRTTAEVAIAWVPHNAAVTGAIVGARRPDQARGVVGAADLELSPRELAAVDAYFAREAARDCRGSDRFGCRRQENEIFTVGQIGPTRVESWIQAFSGFEGGELSDVSLWNLRSSCRVHVGIDRRL
jgi:Aldo/keto reductase family